MKPRDLLKNELLKELVTIKIDTVWKMLRMVREGRLPKKEEEGATGEFDNKGALFLPGGFIFDDSDKRPIVKTPFKQISGKSFAACIRSAMDHDNATLLYPDGMGLSINLDNGFFAEMAGNILATKKMALKRSANLGPKPPNRVTSDDVSASFTPTYFPPPYGSRTKLSSCLATCYQEPRVYYMLCRNQFGLRGKEEQLFWDSAKVASKYLQAKDKTILAPPAIVVCHTTRYRENSLTGLIRILGYGKFGEFATVTLERLTPGLLKDASSSDEDAAELSPKNIVAEFGDIKVVAVIRMYEETRPGTRSRKLKTHIFSPKDDLGIDVEAVSHEARIRYKV